MSFAPKQFIRSVDFLSTENAINTSTGCVNIFGGMSVSRDSYLTNMIVVGNSTVTNLNITGTLTTSNGNSLVSSQWTSIDSNTDIYFGTSSNSFVGIGTTTPTFNLDISGGSRITGALTVGNLNVNTGASITNILNTTICTGTVIITAGSIRASFNSHTIGNIFTTGGNVGINTTTPGSRLEVNGTLKANDITVGNINFTGNLFQNGSAYLGSQWTTTSGNTLTYTSGNISVNSGFTSSFNSNTIGNIFTTGGNIGIGTTAPTSILDVVNSSPLLILRTSSLTEGKIYFGNGNHGIGRNPSISTLTHANDVALWTGGAGASIGFATLLTERMRITDTGNVGIGTISPGATLDVSGTTRLQNDFGITANSAAWNSTLTKGLHMRYSTNGAQDAGYIQSIDRSTNTWYPLSIQARQLTFTTNGGDGSERMIITSTGNIGIGTTAPAYTLDINGTIDATTYTGGIVSVTSITTATIRVTGNADFSTGLTTVTDLTCTNITSGTIRAIGNTFLTSTTTIFNTVNNYNLNSGALNLSGDTVISGSKIYFTTTATGVPTMNGRGAGSKIVLFPETGPGLGDYAIGIESANMWFQVPNASRGFKFYQGTTANLVMTGGNVGIGTITPAYTLDVNGTGRVTGTLLAINNSNTLGNIFTTGGNVGIGTTTPGRPLTVNTAIRIGGSSPVLDFVDTTTQIYRGSTLSELRFVTNSVDRITVTSSGNVGIGINAPSQILHIQRSGTDNYLKIDAGGASTNYSGIMLTEYNINWGWSMRHNALTDLLHISYQDNTPAFTDMLTFTRSGNVGINTTAPAYTLDVNGTTRISSSITTPLIYGDNNSSLTIYNTVAINNTNTNIRETVLQLRRPGTVSQSYSGIADFNMTRYAISGTRAKTRLDIDLSGEFLGDTTSTIMSLQSNGYVGIGTTAPAYTLDINGTIDATTYTGGIVSVTSITTATIRVTGNADLSTGLTTVTDLTGTNITSGTIRASTLISTANLSAGAITGGTIRITTSLLAIGNSNTLGNIFTTGGNVGIGTISPSYPLHVSGDIYATGDVISFSDARLKTDVVTIENALDKVSGLRGVYYTNTNTNTRETGVIAQEIAEILPEVVADRGEYLGVAYGNIVGILIEAIKELKTRIVELESSRN